jgi:hypothetical protein
VQPQAEVVRAGCCFVCKWTHIHRIWRRTYLVAAGSRYLGLEFDGVSVVEEYDEMKQVIHAISYFIARNPKTRCGIFVDFDKVTALGEVTCKNCLRTEGRSYV